MLSKKRGECEWVILRQKEVTHRHRRRMTIAMEPIHDAEVITIVSIVQGVCVCVEGAPGWSGGVQRHVAVDKCH